MPVALTWTWQVLFSILWCLLSPQVVTHQECNYMSSSSFGLYYMYIYVWVEPSARNNPLEVADHLADQFAGFFHHLKKTDFGISSLLGQLALSDTILPHHHHLVWSIRGYRFDFNLQAETTLWGWQITWHIIFPTFLRLKKAWLWYLLSPQTVRSH